MRGDKEGKGGKGEGLCLLRADRHPLVSEVACISVDVAAPYYPDAEGACYVGSGLGSVCRWGGVV